MSTLTVWRSRTPEGAENGETALRKGPPGSGPKSGQPAELAGGRPAGTGTGDGFLAEVRQKLTPGAPGLFLPPQEEME